MKDNDLVRISTEINEIILSNSREDRKLGIRVSAVHAGGKWSIPERLSKELQRMIFREKGVELPEELK